MKIAYVCSRYHPYIGGVETHVKEISERLVKKGFEIEVLTTDPTSRLIKEEIINGIIVKRFKSFAPNEAYYYSPQLKTYLNKNANKYDIIHAHNYHSLPALYAAQTKDSNIFIFTPHYLGKGQTLFRNILHIPYKFVGNNIFKNSDHIICVSEFEKNILREHFNIQNKLITIIPNGINLNEINKYEWNPKSSINKILYCGRLEKNQKNIDKLIKSIFILVNKYNVNIEFKIIGSGTYEKGMKNLIQQLNLQQYFSWEKRVSRINYLKEISTSNIFIMPSEYECFGIAVAEAIAMGVPTVVANKTSLREFVELDLAMGISPPITPLKIARSLYKALNEPQIANKKCFNNKIISWDKVVNLLIDNIYR